MILTKQESKEDQGTEHNRKKKVQEIIQGAQDKNKEMIHATDDEV